MTEMRAFFEEMTEHAEKYWESMGLLMDVHFKEDHQYIKDLGLTLDWVPGIHVQGTHQEFFDRIKSALITFGPFMDSQLLFQRNGDFDALYHKFIDVIPVPRLVTMYGETKDQFIRHPLEGDYLNHVDVGDEFSAKKSILRPLTIPIMVLYTIQWKWHHPPPRAFFENDCFEKERPTFFS